jgi:hypothetical protein
MRSFDYVKPCWIMSIHAFLVQFELRVEFTHTRRPKPLCDHDQFLMDTRRLESLPVTTMRKLNACRMWLQVSRLSEITNPEGFRLHQDSLHGRISHPKKAERLQWPRQDRPPAKWWRIWSQCLRRSFSTDGRDTKLRVSLGTWHPESLPTANLSAHSDFVFFGVTAPRLFRRVTTAPSAFDVYPIEGSVIDGRLTRATTFAPTRQRQVDQLPIGSVPVPCLPLIHRRIISH